MIIVKKWLALRGLGIALLASTVNATEIYQWKDAQGQVHYSDRPAAQAEKLDLNPGYTWHNVKTVYDGDTILLDNGDKVRFLGINTPEVERRNKLGQAGGEEAKRWLETQLKGQRVRLERDVEATDKYDRVLAHVFTEEPRHLNLELVAQGLASVVIHPPNEKYTQQLLQAQDQAESRKLGIWGRLEYAPIDHQQLTAKPNQGWVRITGTIQRIGSSKQYVFLNFSDRTSIKIHKKALNFFPDLNRYQGKNIEVRGWVNQYKGRLQINARHGSAIKILD